MADGGEDGVDRVAVGAEQEVAVQQAVGLHVADDGLDGVAPPELAPDGGREATFLPADEDAGAVGVMAAISAIDIGALDGDTGMAAPVIRSVCAICAASVWPS